MNEIQNKFQSSTFITSRLVRSPGKALFCAQALLIALAGCSNDSGGGNGNGGESNGGSSGQTALGGNGGTQATGGTSGSETGGEPNAGTGGTSGGAGGESGGTSGAGGESGGGGGTDSGVARECAVTTGDNAANLGVKRAEISTRKLGNVATGNVMRIERDPSTGDIIYMNQSGNFWKVNVAAGSSAPIDLGFGGGNNCRSMTFASDGTMYVQCHGGGGISVNIKKGVPNGAGGRTWTTLVTSEGYPSPNNNFDHSFNGLAVSPDEQSLYFASGSRTDHGELEQGLREVPITSAIFKVPVNGDTPLMLQNNETALQPYLYADGTRNSFDLAFSADGELFAIDNGPDIDFPDEINWIREGKHYGFPWRFGDQPNPNMDPTYSAAGDQRLHAQLQAVALGTYKYEADFPAAPAVPLIDPIKNLGPDNDKFRIGKTGPVQDASEMGMAFYGVTAHRSPLGLSFDNKGKMCGDYYKSAFVVSYGAVTDVMGDGGEDVSMLQFTKAGDDYEMHVTQLVTGLSAPIDSVLVDNKLYVVEYGNGGGIYEITFPLPAN